MLHPRRAGCTLAALFLLTILQGGAATTAAAGGDGKGKKPSLSLKVSPSLVVAPAKVHAVVEVKGGADDYEEFYCPRIEWEWGDETRSESVQDCEPYEAGKSSIKRRFSTDHTYQESGQFKVTFRMKRKDKVFASASTNLQVQPGPGERSF